MPSGVYPRTEELKREVKRKLKATWAAKRADGWISPSNGYRHTAEAKRKISLAHSGEGNPNYGKKHSAETKSKMSDAHKGQFVSGETRKKLSLAQKGRKSPAKATQKMKATWAKKIAEGYVGPNKGQKRTEEVAQKLKETWAKKRAAGYVSPVRGSNSPNWIPDREEVARRAVVYSLMMNYLNLPLNAKIDDHEVTNVLGYSKSEFITAIESKFYPGMKWKDRGKGKGRWQIHHKIPVSWFVKEGITDPKIINALDNLRPLWRCDYTEEHKMLRKCTKEQRQLWVELFVWHVEHKRRMPIDLEAFSDVGSYDLAVNA